MERRAFLGAIGGGVGAVACGGLAGCVERTLGSGLDDEDFDIGMSANAFLPEEYEVSVGKTVVWGNNGTRGHTVTAYDGQLPDGADFFASGDVESTEAARDAWRSGKDGNITPGKTFSHTFEIPGEHHYFCIPHEGKGMVGVVVVTE
jgi:plastocyanin